MNDGRQRELELYTNANGSAIVEKEIKRAKLSERESGRLDELIGRAEQGKLRDGDIEHISGEIYELRLRGERRIFRLFYATVGEDGAVILGLVFFGKKTQKAPADKIKLAEQRLSEFRSQ